ncbi:DnaB-like helicase C-terminal domain-containing protein [Spirochaetota bacterium]
MKKSKDLLSMGFHELDDKLNGLNKGDLVVIASRPGVGKTAFTLNILSHIAKKEKVPVLYFSLEETASKIGLKLLCIETKIESESINNGSITPEDLKEIFDAAGKLSETDIYIEDMSSITVLQIRDKLIKMQKEFGIGLAVIDYLQLIKCNPSIQRDNHITILLRLLKQVAMELSIPVIVTSQLPLHVDERDGIPDLNDFGDDEDNVDVIIFMHRLNKIGSQSGMEDIANIIIAKNKNGEVGDFPLRFIENNLRYESLVDKKH